MPPRELQDHHYYEGNAIQRYQYVLIRIQIAVRTILVNHLKSTFPIMYCLFLALYTRKDERPTQAEIELARGNVPADTEAAKVYLGTVESTTSNILKALRHRQRRRTRRPMYYLFLLNFVVRVAYSFL
jgi:hypothetical protein